MKNNSRKSKAFIITFILVLLLLISGYYAFSNKERLFGTNGKLSTNRILSPLFGTSGKTNSNGGVVDNNGTSGGGTDTGTGTGDGTSGPGNGDGSGSGIGDGSGGYGTSGSGTSGSGTVSGTGDGTSGSGNGDGSGSGIGDGSGSGSGIKPANFEFKPIPSPSNYDRNNPNNLNYNPTDPYNPKYPNDTRYATNPYNPTDPYNPNDTRYTTNPYNPTGSINLNDSKNNLTVRENECPIDPLENYLTKEEREKLASLTADFYSLAYNLRTRDDIKLITDEIIQIEKDIVEAKQLTLECKQQKSDYRYTGPKTIYGNPYYAKETRYDFDPSLGGAYPEMNELWIAPNIFVEYVTELSEKSGEHRSKSGWPPRINEKHLFAFKNSYLNGVKSDWLENVVSVFLGKELTFSARAYDVFTTGPNLGATRQEKEEGVAYVRNLIRLLFNHTLTDENGSGPIGRDNNAEGYFLPNNYAIFEAMFDIW